MGLIVTGMHRSGTSAVARCLNALGVPTGTGRLMPPAAPNPRGFFERLDVAELDDAWLERLGGSWWAPPEVSRRTWSRLDDEMIQDGRSRIDVLSDPTACWFLKDPRMSLLLPLWDRLALTRLPIVVVVRSPAEVAASLTMRNGTGRIRAQALWMEYVLRLLADVGADRPSLLLDFGALLADPDRTAKSLADFVQTTQNVDVPSNLVDAAATTIEPLLQRHRACDEDALGVTEPQSLYQALAKHHGEPVPMDIDLSRPSWLDETLNELQEVWRLRTASDRAQAEVAEVHGKLVVQDDGLATATAREDDAREQEGRRWQEQMDALRSELDYVREERADLRARLEALADVQRELVVQDDGPATATAREDDAREQEGRRWQEQMDVLRSELDYVREERADLRARLEALADVQRERDVGQERESAAQLRITQLEAEVDSTRPQLAQLTTTADGLALELAALRPRLEMLADARREAGLAEDRECLALERIEHLERGIARRQAMLDESEAAVAHLGDDVAGLREQLGAESAAKTRLLSDLTAAQDRLRELEDQHDSHLRGANVSSAQAAEAEAQVIELETQLDDLATTATGRRDALWAMSRELESYRAAAVVARRAVQRDELPDRVPDAVPVESGRSAIESLLAVARHERDGLEAALRVVIQEKQQASGELAMVRASRGYRWTRWLAAHPTDAAERGGHDHSAG